MRVARERVLRSFSKVRTFSRIKHDFQSELLDIIFSGQKLNHVLFLPHHQSLVIVMLANTVT